MKKCPFCVEEIQDKAIKCKHCGEFVGLSMNPDHTSNWIRHYDNLLWTTSSILLAANGVLINALMRTEKDNFLLRLFIAVLGYSLTMVTVYFAASFRNLRHGYADEYYKDLNDTTKAETIRKIHESAMKQWPIYVLMFGLIGIFWSFSLFVFSNCYNELTLLIGVLATVILGFRLNAYFKIGSHENSGG